MKIKTSQSSCSVQNWLDQSLEKRGIDARVYSKYILSLVTQTDDDDGEQDNDLSLLCPDVSSDPLSAICNP